MEQNTTQKTQSNKLKIIFNIWSYAFASMIASLFIWRIFAWLLVGIIGEIPATILNSIVLIAILIFAMRIAVKTVLAKTIILKEDITKISIGVALIFVAFQVLLAIYSYFRLNSIDLVQIGNFVITDIAVFLIVYLWLKKLIKAN